MPCHLSSISQHEEESSTSNHPLAMDAGGHRWTEEVDDLVDAGDVDGAISLLESVVSNLSTTTSSPSPGDNTNLRLATALGDLAGLHASRGNTLRADDLRSRAIVLRFRAQAPAPQALGDHGAAEESSSQDGATDSKDSKVSANFDEKNEDGDEDDDWEAIADRGAHDETLVRPLQEEIRVSSCSSSEKSSTPSSGPKRRGRGSFLYDKSVLYSDQHGSERDLDDKGSDPRIGSKGHVNEKKDKAAATQFGTRHALVLYDFLPSTRTTDLERIFEKFGDHGVAIRWVTDTVALAVFRTPSAANEAKSCVPSKYKVRLLKEDDDLLSKIDGTDLDPPMPRPKTSARTAQRLIAHGMGLRQFTNFSADELKQQEAARRNRITARQAARDDAWGDED